MKLTLTLEKRIINVVDMKITTATVKFKVETTHYNN